MWDISKLYNRKQGIGNRELAPCFLYWCIIPNFLKVQIGNKESVPGSFLTIIGFLLVSVFVNCISM